MRSLVTDRRVIAALLGLGLGATIIPLHATAASLAESWHLGVWFSYLAVCLHGIVCGFVLGLVADGYPAISGLLASLAVYAGLYWQGEFQLGLDRGVELLLQFETHFASVYLAAFAVFMIRGGGMAYPRFIGLRYLRFKMITGISVGGVALGVAALAVVLSVMSGFEADMRARIIGSNAHAIVQKRGLDFSEYRSTMQKIGRVQGVQASSPFVFSEVMASAGNSLSGVFLKGIDPESVAEVSPIELEEGSFERFAAPAGTPGILIGRELKKTLRVELGDAVELLTPVGDEVGLAGALPKSRVFELVGVFHTGMYEFDAKSVYITLDQAQEFFGLGDSVTGIAMRFDQVDKASAICKRVVAALDGYPYFTRTWYEMNRNLFSALKLQKVGMFIVLLIVILVSAFGVIATLIMLVWEKIKEIAILKSMGATGDGIMKVFMVEGITIGLTGTVLGVLLGVFVCWALGQYGLALDPEVYYVERLPVAMNPLEIMMIAGMALHICFIATIYPSSRAARLTPVEGLRYD